MLLSNKPKAGAAPAAAAGGAAAAASATPEKPPVLNKMLSGFVFGPTEDINKDFALGKTYGESKFGKAVHGTERKTKKDYAVKIIAKAKFSRDCLAQFRQEVEIMEKLNHKHIIRFHKVYEDQFNLYIVMDLCTGGEMFDRIKKKPYSEKDAAACVRSVFDALAYLHANGIAHCDLKPENFLYESDAPDAAVKMIDFGLSKYLKPRMYFTQVVGTSYYVAPDVLKHKFNEAADMWSMGVVLFVMIFGFPPFYAETNAGIYKAIQKGFAPEVKRGYGAWFPEAMPVSAGAREFISKLLESDPAKRMTAEEALNHPWVKGDSASGAVLDPMVLKGLRQFTARPRLRAAILRFMSDTLSEHEVESLQKSFALMDENKDGTVTLAELKKAMSALPQGSPSVDTAEVESIMKLVDADGSGSISYEELLLSYVHKKLTAKEERLWAAFQKLDADGDGRVTLAEVETALSQTHIPGLGQQPASPSPDRPQLARMLSEVDQNKDGSLDYEEYLKCMWDEGEEASKKAVEARAKLAQASAAAGAAPAAAAGAGAAAAAAK